MSLKVDQKHRVFAWAPTFIPEATYDSIVVHAHWVWWENVARKRSSPGYPWEYYTWAGEPTLRELANQ